MPLFPLNFRLSIRLTRRGLYSQAKLSQVSFTSSEVVLSRSCYIPLFVITLDHHQYVDLDSIVCKGGSVCPFYGLMLI